MRNRWLAVLATIGLLHSAPALAQPKPIDASATKEWKHKPSGVKLPAVLVGLPRNRLVAFAGEGVDVVGDYNSADGAEAITIYLFRDVSGSLPVWFDRARTIVQLLPEKYPNAKGLGVRPFIPRGQKQATGLIEMLSVEGKVRATGLMLIPVNGFYAKVRASSMTRDAASLEQFMLTAVNAINWASKTAASTASPIENCPTPLPERPAAVMAVVNKDDRMMSGLVGGLLSQLQTTSKIPVAVRYCREPGPAQFPYGVYRANGSSDSYLMALLDSGRAVQVGSSDLLSILSEINKAKRYSVAHVELDRIATYADFATLPHPGQAIELVRTSKPLSVGGTWGKGAKQISIGVTE